MGPQNGMVGEGDYGTSLPQTQPVDNSLTAERNMARFSKTKEFKKLEEVVNSRINYYKQFAPGSQNPIAYRDLPNDERGWRTLVADVMIEEFQAMLNAYKIAADAIKEKDKNV